MMMRPRIAIVGVGLRLPGEIESLEDLHAVLRARRCVVDRVPPDRWDADRFFHPDFRKPAHIHATRGGFVRDVDRFDAAFFGIAPAEARRMDPQQRLVLEAGFRAIEDAGLPCESLAGRRVAVIVGCSGRDYEGVQGTASQRSTIGPTSNTGNALSIVSNRLSYLFDLRGPSFSVDTACSSSLTALHCACRAIWDGEAEAALAGGVNVILRPEPTIGFSKGGYLSPDGECRAFSDHANGYVRSEGVGMVMLRPLDEALANGDRIYGVIHGSAVNQDGRTMGMTLPSAVAQIDLLQRAYRDAEIDLARIGYVEAHGTGTPAGDPVEAEAIGTVLGRARAGAPLHIGSVKTNVGHLESAAGMAGLFKLLLTLRERVVFGNLHLRAPNPKIAWQDLNLRVTSEPVPLPSTGPLYGGVNSFGFGGANAHLVVESPPAARRAEHAEHAEHAPRPSRTPAVFLSARSPAALSAMARDVATEALRGGSLEVYAEALVTRRSSFEHRLAVFGHTPAELASRLRAYADGTGPDAATGIRVGRIADAAVAPKVAFVFCGQGAQWWGMARDLLGHSRLFRDAVAEVSGLLAGLGWLADERSRLEDELAKDADRSRIDETRIAQPCLFAVHVGLARLLQAAGVEPAAACGHSIGELAAAVTAGALSLAEAARVVVHRSRSQAIAEGKGAMAGLGVTERDARAIVERYPGRVEIAAVNGPRSITIAGDGDAIRAIGSELEAAGAFFRLLDVSVPFHCHLMDPIETAFRRGIGEVERGAGDRPFYSTVTGERLAGDRLDADYWWRNIREPVSFARAMSALADDGITTFVEIGPHPVLRRGAEELLRASGSRATYVSTLRRQADDFQSLADALGALFAAGVRCTPEPRTSAALDRTHATLPIHAFDRVRHWQESAEAAAARRGVDKPDHPHLDRIERSGRDAAMFVARASFDARVEAYLADHQVQGTIVVPGAAQLELVLAAAHHAGLPGTVFVEDVEFRLPIVVAGDDASANVRVEVYDDEGHFVVVGGSEDAPIEHSRGRINHADESCDPPVDWAAVRATLTDVLAPEQLYEEARSAGLELGPAFHTITSFRTNGGETFATLEVPAALAHEATRFAIHPVLVDGMLQTAALGTLSQAASRGRARGLYLPAGVERCRLHRRHAAGALACHARPRRAESGDDSGNDVVLDVVAADDSGAPVLSLEKLRLRPVPGAGRRQALRAAHTYEMRWRPAEVEPAAAPDGARPPIWLVLPPREDRGAITTALVGALEARGKRVVLAPPAPGLAQAVLDRVDPRELDGVLDLTALSEHTEGPGACDRILADGPAALYGLLRTLAERRKLTDLRVRIVTRGAFRVSGDAGCDPGGGLAWGAGRVIASELPTVDTAIIDLARESSDQDWQRVLDVLATPPPAPELAVRDGRLHVLRLERVAVETGPFEVDLACSDVRAVVRSPGVVGSVAVAPSARQAPGPDEVVVRVRAVGLNFKDVVVAMGMLGSKAWSGGMSGAELGMDCAGVVAAVGENVTTVRVGQEVIALARSCLGTWAIAHRHHLIAMPRGMSFADAAALPTAYLTASLALEHVARLRRGETVLVHAGAGGVGIAAIQIAQLLGAHVIATTSTDDKRAFLRRLGVDQILGSRTPQFRDAVLALTGGRGVEVVLNSLSGRMFTQGIRALAPFGRFVEIGKVDIYKNRTLGIEVLGENRSFQVLDVNRWAAARKPHIAELFDEMCARVERGAFARLPVRSFPLDRAAEALTTLSQARHIGKVVIEVPAAGVVSAVPRPRVEASAEAAYLVAGGTSGFGLAVAGWLVERGARHVVLASRRGLVDDADAAVLQALRDRGADIEVQACAVDDRAAVERLVTGIAARRPLRGVFHAAMVLDDAPLHALTYDRFESVARPKVHGAWNLHAATRACELDMFVMFSSVAGVFGTPGQGNYAAANAFLDAFAAFRRAQGLPATSISFGPIDDVGVVARASAEQRRKITGHGIAMLRVGEALEMLEHAIVERAIHRVAAVIDFRRIGALGTGRRFAHLASRDEDAAASGRSRLADRVRAAPAADQAALVVEALARFAAQLVGASDPIDADTSLVRVGIDSLGAAQLETWLDTELGASIPLVRLLRGPTLRELATEVVGGLAGGAPRSRWIVRRPAPRARMRVFCFPPMAMGDEAFDAWTSLVPADVEVCSVHIPALGDPDDGILRGPIEDLRARVASEIAAHCELPFGFYGHSIGGWIALEVAAELRTQTGLAPGFVCLGAVPSADMLAALLPHDAPSPEAITEEAIDHALRALGLSESARALDELARGARRDLWLGKQAGFGQARQAHALRGLASPILLVRASGDPLATVDRAALERLGLSVADSIELTGGHLFLLDPAATRELVERALSPRIGFMLS